MQLVKNISRFPRALLLAGAFFLPLVTAGCAHQGSMVSAKGQGSSVPVLKSFRDGWDRRDPQAIAATMSDTATFISPYTGQPLSREQYARYLQDLFQAVPDFTVTKSEGGMMDGTTAAEEWIVTGTWTKPWSSGPLAGITPTGKAFTLPGANFIRLKGGKIDSITQYFDQMSLLTQIGVIQIK